MKGKLKIILPVLLLVLVGAGGAYKFLLAGGGSAKKAAPPKVVGDLLPLSPDFTINLDGGHYGKVSVAARADRRRARRRPSASRDAARSRRTPPCARSSPTTSPASRPTS